MMNKELVNAAFETTLDTGVGLERRLFHSPVRLRGPEGGHGRLRREAKAGVQGALSREGPMAIVLDEKFAKLDDHWSPRIVGQVERPAHQGGEGEGRVRLARPRRHRRAVHGPQGRAQYQYRDRDNIVRAGEMFVVPRGVEHRPVAAEECEMVLSSPRARSTPATPAGR